MFARKPYYTTHYEKFSGALKPFKIARGATDFKWKIKGHRICTKRNKQENKMYD